MTLAARLVLAVVLTAAFSVTLTGVLSLQAASERVPRAFGMMEQRGPGPGGEARPMAGAALASRELLSELQGATARAAVVALTLAVVAGGWVALRASRPIARLADVTRRYSGGDRAARALVAGPREVADLAHAFNDLVERLHVEEVQRQRFTSDVAHELRTPLTVLKSELEAIEDGLMDADPTRVGQLLEQVDLLARLVQDLRTLASAEAGAMGIEHAPVDVGALAARAAATFGSRAAARHAHLDVAVEPAVVSGDAERLHQVVNALLDNAFHHVPDGGHVWVRTASDGAHVLLEVADDGPGVPDEHRAHVFRRFYRADAARGRADGGSGLGLAIVAALVDLHGGRVDVDERPGGGARFRVHLPSLPDRVAPADSGRPSVAVGPPRG